MKWQLCSSQPGECKRITAAWQWATCCLPIAKTAFWFCIWQVLLSWYVHHRHTPVVACHWQCGFESQSKQWTYLAPVTDEYERSNYRHLNRIFSVDVSCNISINLCSERRKGELTRAALWRLMIAQPRTTATERRERWWLFLEVGAEIKRLLGSMIKWLWHWPLGVPSSSDINLQPRISIRRFSYFSFFPLHQDRFYIPNNQEKRFIGACLL